MSHFGTYTGYRESGIDWVGPIPSHWSIKAIKRLVRSRVDRTNGLLEGTYIGLEDVQSGSGRYMPTENDSRRSEDSMVALFSEGDVLYGKLRPYLRKACIPDFNGAASTEFLILTPLKGTQSTWLLNWLLTPELTQQIEAGCEGAKMPRADWEHVGGLKLPVPPIAEQQEICSTLAKETVRIDTLIEKKTRFIELLDEKRQALITHAVAKGLNPDAPMKDSGVEWLGEVPRDWRVAPLMRLTAPGRAIMYGIVLPGPNVEEGVPIVKGGDVRVHRLKLDLLCRTTVEIEAAFARARLAPDDLVYSIRGSIGDVELVPPELEGANITQDVARISPRSGVDSRWLQYVLKSSPVFAQLEHKSLGATIRGINIWDLKRARVPVPSTEEQRQIADHLDRETSLVDKLARLTKKSVQLLRERRGALITAAVTGKIDLRDAA